MNPIEAGARAYDVEYASGAYALHERCIRAAAIAMVGALQEPEFDVWDLAGDVRTPEEFRAELIKQLTDEGDET